MEMRLANKPRLVIVFLVALFMVMLGIALYAPAFIASYSSKNSTSLTVTPLSYLHSGSVSDSISDRIPQANYTGVLYVQHVCVYHE
jgi:hypothetical protein